MQGHLRSLEALFRHQIVDFHACPGKGTGMETLRKKMGGQKKMPRERNGKMEEEPRDQEPWAKVRGGTEGQEYLPTS